MEKYPIVYKGKNNRALGDFYPTVPPPERPVRPKKLATERWYFAQTIARSADREAYKKVYKTSDFDRKRMPYIAFQTFSLILNLLCG